MTGKDIKNVVMYLHNVDLEDFARDIYDREGEAVDYYVKNKYSQMQEHQPLWIGELDNMHLNRLADAVNKKGES